MADALRLTLENLASMRGSGAAYLDTRYADIVHRRAEDTRTEADIIAQVKKAWGGEKH